MPEIKFYGIKDKCCTAENMQFYDTCYDEDYYQCKTCMKLFTRKTFATCESRKKIILKTAIKFLIKKLERLHNWL